MALFPHFAIPTGLQHGTVTVRSGGVSCEVTTFRTDGDYPDHRHPAAVTLSLIHICKSLLPLLLALLLAAGLCACGSNTDPDEPQPDDPIVEEPAIPDQVPVRITATRLADGAVLSDRRWVYDQYGNMTMEIDYQFGLLEQGYDTYTCLLYTSRCV